MKNQFFRKAVCILLAVCAVPAMAGNAETLDIDNELQSIEEMVNLYADSWIEVMYYGQAIKWDVILKCPDC